LHRASVRNWDRLYITTAAETAKLARTRTDDVLTSQRLYYKVQTV